MAFTVKYNLEDVRKLCTRLIRITVNDGSRSLSVRSELRTNSDQIIFEKWKKYNKIMYDRSTSTIALEEKQREEEQKEQKFRDEILHQRKLKLQEATEKFQRAHLPPSQRRRPAYTIHKRPTPSLENALEQIQGSVPSTYYYFSNHRSPNSTRTTDAPSSVSSVGHSAWSRKQQAAAKLDLQRAFEERSAVQVDSNQLYFQHRLEEAQRLLEEQHLSNLQEKTQNFPLTTK
ncbi:unnamed protein product [Ranitomeya imitator]|uniref:Uncharacterized protein n=1 Tax=Ranitomeya imitator TaxID=111125 RepID=A0ABN9L2U0_9NEOB|nr:unnamed protein product [Ranitomeya imitator]